MRQLKLSVIATVAFVRAAAAGIVTVGDGTFADADWQVVVSSFRSTGGAVAGGSVVASQQSGGYPGAMRQVTDNIPPAPSGSEFSTVFGIHLRSGATYDPSVQGPIATIDYFEDARAVTGGQLSGFAVRQNGKTYYTQAGVYSAITWGPVVQLGIVPAVFTEVTADGPISDSKPDFSATGAPLELGFVRASSNGNGGGAYAVVSAIDNWKVRINPPCVIDADCDDGDACTTDACNGGVCAAVDQSCDDGDACTIDGCADGTCMHAALDCDDADQCTADTCVSGVCEHTASADVATVTAKIDELLALLAGPACGEEPLAKKLRKRIVKRLKKAEKALEKADQATKDALIGTLLDRADALIAKAREALATAANDGKISPACAAVLDGFLADIDFCTDGLPHP